MVHLTTLLFQESESYMIPHTVYSQREAQHRVDYELCLKRQRGIIVRGGALAHFPKKQVVIAPKIIIV